MRKHQKSAIALTFPLTTRSPLYRRLNARNLANRVKQRVNHWWTSPGSPSSSPCRC